MFCNKNSTFDLVIPNLQFQKLYTGFSKRMVSFSCQKNVQICFLLLGLQWWRWTCHISQIVLPVRYQKILSVTRLIKHKSFTNEDLSKIRRRISWFNYHYIYMQYNHHMWSSLSTRRFSIVRDIHMRWFCDAIKKRASYFQKLSWILNKKIVILVRFIHISINKQF